MRDLFIPALFLSYVAVAAVLADPEPIYGIDLETDESVYIEPQSEDEVYVMDQDGNLSYQVVQEVGGSTLITHDPETGEFKTYHVEER